MLVPVGDASPAAGAIGSRHAPTRPESHSLRLGVGSHRWVAAADAASAIAVLGVPLPVTSHRPLGDAALVVAWLIALAATKAYDTPRVPFWPDEVRRIWGAAVGLAAVLPLAAGSLGGPVRDVAGSAIAAALFASGSTAARWLLRAGVALRTGGRVGALRVVVAGHRRDVRRIVGELPGGRFSGYDVVDVCDSSPGSPDFLTSVARAVHTADADAVLVVPCRHLDAAALRRLSWQLERLRARLLVSTSLLDVAADRTRLTHAGALPLVSVRHARTRGGLRIAKEVCERALAAAALVLLAPMLVVLAALVCLDTPGPVLFRQQRVGRDGVLFPMWKFRTMHRDAEAMRPSLEQLVGPATMLFKLFNDPRTTRVGRFLRRYSLDELPQLVNVVRGEMALVGPRPPLPQEVARYQPDVWRRLAVKPGITGLWQVSGRSDLSWEDSVRLDLRYVDNWSWGRDWVIMLRTLGAVLSRRGAY